MSLKWLSSLSPARTCRRSPERSVVEGEAGGASPFHLSNLCSRLIIYLPAHNAHVTKASKLVITFFSTLPAFYGLWLLFVGTFSLHELLIGIIAAVLASIGMVVVGIFYSTPFSPTAKDLLAGWRLPWYVLSDTWVVLAVAAKDLVGSHRAESLFRVVPFRAGSEKDPQATARRVLATVYSTMAPNSIVLGVNTNNQKLLSHQIKRSSVPKMTRQLGAEA